MCRDEPQGISIPTEDVAEVGITDACGLVQHGGEHRLQITGKAAYNLKYVRSGRLLFQRLESEGPWCVRSGQWCAGAVR